MQSSQIATTTSEWVLTPSAEFPLLSILKVLLFSWTQNTDKFLTTVALSTIYDNVMDAVRELPMIYIVQV